MTAPKTDSRWLRYLGLSVLSIGVVLSIAHPMCDLVFACGCSPLWSGGAETCRHGPWLQEAAPFCPWCTMDLMTLAFLTCLVVAMALVASYPVRRSSVWRHMVVVVLLSLISLWAFGLGTAAIYRYPMGILAEWVPELCGRAAGELVP